MLRFRFIVLIVVITTLTLCAAVRSFAQNENVFLHPQKFYKKYFPHLRIKRNLPDSSYVKLYPNFLSASINLLSPTFRFDMLPRSMNASGKVSFRANSGDIVGAVVNYRYISAGFAFVLNSGMQMNNQFAKSKYRTATIKYNSSGYMFQFKYIRVKGLTDVNAFPDRNESYIHRPDIMAKEFQFESTYNPAWRKYSYTAPFTFSERQVKSFGGILFKAGMYYSQISGDSSLIGDTKLQHYSVDFADVNTIRALTIRLAPGAGANIVVREKYYASAAVFPSYDIYFYKYLKNPDDKAMGNQTLAFAFEGNASIGYQSRRLYAGLRCEFERNRVLLRGLQSNKVYAILGLEFGYRFNAPNVVKKIYRETMPPGM